MTQPDSGLRIALGLELDVDYVAGGTFALMGKKGAGKSFTTRVIAEEFWKHDVPFVLIDPMGANWGLRSSADGRGEGIPIPIFGGRHGDAPLERTAGAVMADVIMDGVTAILDVSELGSHAAEREFVYDFFERLYRRNESLVHVLLDEADLYAPQKPAPGDQKLLGMVDNVVRRGRNKAIAITLITQRSAVLNKDVLTQVDGLLVLRLVGPPDRNTVREWMADHAEPEQIREVMASLPSLANGETWVWVPELQIFERVQVRMSDTFDSSPTRKRGPARPRPKGYADVDLAGISERIAGTIERAKAEDPKELRREIAELRRQLADRPAETRVETVTETVEIPVLADGTVEKLEHAVTSAAEASAALARFQDEIRGELRRVTAARSSVPPSAPSPASRPARTVPRAAPAARPVAAADGDLRLGRAHRAILSVLAQRNGLVTTKRQLAVATGYSIRGGGFNNPLGALRTSGLIVGTDPIEITNDGLAAIEGHYDPLPTGPELLEHWVSQLGKAHGLILRELARHYPHAITKEDLAAATGYAPTGGGFNNPLGKLRTLELIEGSSELRLTDALGQQLGGVA